MTDRPARFWMTLDHLASAFTLACLMLYDRLAGPWPRTSADEKREADQERLRRSFGVDPR
jgi:hypothetical protein